MLIESYRLNYFVVEQIIMGEGTSVTHLKWVMREDADSLVVAAGNDHFSCLQVWELRENAKPVHTLITEQEPQYLNTVVSIFKV